MVPPQSIGCLSQHGIEIKTKLDLPFSKHVEIIPVESPYSVVYGRHPNNFFASPAALSGECNVEDALPNADPFTGVDATTMSQRRAGINKSTHAPRQRADILRRVLQDGAHWEINSADSLQSSVSATTFKKQVQSKNINETRSSREYR